MTDGRPDDSYSDEEAARRRDAVVRRMIATLPSPHKPNTRKPKPAKKSARKPRR
jgi:hypothetical protein